MPIAAPAITTAILGANPSLTGPAWFQTASGIGTAVQIWAVAPVNVIMVGSVNGTVGGGGVTGKFLMPPTTSLVNAAVAAAGLVGPQAQQVAFAVGMGVATSLNATATYVGSSVGAIGVDISKVTFANPVTLIGLLSSNLAARGVFGPVALQLSIGLGNGIAAMVATGGGTGVAAGAPGPSPGTGITRSSLL